MAGERNWGFPPPREISDCQRAMTVLLFLFVLLDLDQFVARRSDLAGILRDTPAQCKRKIGNDDGTKRVHAGQMSTTHAVISLYGGICEAKFFCLGLGFSLATVPHGAWFPFSHRDP